jgi:D-beta-D-heptose 7-phosphate kinase/D-beta-D-heptose 1-phosphate adenosyltransferase
MSIHIPDFSSARVLVVGDLMLDRYWHGPTSRISPEAPVPVVHVNEIEERPGGAGNVALNIAVLGATSTVIGLTGDDDAANALETSLQAANVNTRFVRLANNPTITKLRVMSRNQQLIRLDFEDGFVGEDLSALEKLFGDNLDSHDVVVCSDYGKGSLRNVQALIALCKQKNIPVLVDPKGADFQRYQGASLVTPNLAEFEAVVGKCADDAELVSKAQALCKQCDFAALLITRSEHGMSLIQQDEVHHLPTHAREVYECRPWRLQLLPVNLWRRRPRWPILLRAWLSPSRVPRASVLPNCVPRCANTLWSGAVCLIRASWCRRWPPVGSAVKP